MIIEIIDANHVKVFGNTPEEAHEKALIFFNAFIGDKWLSWIPSMEKQYEDGKRWAITIRHKDLNITIPS